MTRKIYLIMYERPCVNVFNARKWTLPTFFTHIQPTFYPLQMSTLPKSPPCSNCISRLSGRSKWRLSLDVTSWELMRPKLSKTLKHHEILYSTTIEIFTEIYRVLILIILMDKSPVNYPGCLKEAHCLSYWVPYYNPRTNWLPNVFNMITLRLSFSIIRVESLNWVVASCQNEDQDSLFLTVEWRPG